MDNRWGRPGNLWNLPVMASDQLRGGSDDTSAEAEGKLPPVVMFAFPESSLSLSSRKKGQSHPHWHLLSFFPTPSFQSLTATRSLQPKAKAWQTQLPELGRSMAFSPLPHLRKHTVRAARMFPHNPRSQNGSEGFSIDSGSNGKRLQLCPKLQDLG